MKSQSLFFTSVQTLNIFMRFKKHNIFSVIPDFNIKLSLVVNFFVLVEYWQSDLNLKVKLRYFLVN